MTRSPVNASWAHLRSSTMKNNGWSVSLLMVSSSLRPHPVTKVLVPLAVIWE